MTLIGDPRFTPDPAFHRLLSSMPLAAAPGRPEITQQTMTIVCPKCRAQFKHPLGTGALFCKAATTPFFGEYRGCGWMLAVTRPYKGGTRGYADAVVDCRKYFRPDRGYFHFDGAGGKFIRDLFARVYERWEAWNLGKTRVREDGSIYFEFFDEKELSVLASDNEKSTD